MFDNPRYVGDPLNAVRIFNEKACDEIMLFDIGANAEGGYLNYELIAQCASECRMPLCYGGGIRDVDEIKNLINLGVEKVAINTAALRDPKLLGAAAEQVGNQSVVAVVDVLYDSSDKKYVVTVNRGKVKTHLDLCSWVKQLERIGVGEIVVNSVDRDGMMCGFDLVLARMIRNNVSVPITILGGAGSVSHIEDLFKNIGVIGAACGSLFIFKGKLNAVLINYPSSDELDRLCRAAWRL
jgi:cyclase